MRSDDIVDDLPGGDLLARWLIVDGQPRCWAGPYRISETAEEVVAAQRVTNALVRDRLAAVEVFEAAQALIARVAVLGEPPETVAVAGRTEGQPAAIPNPKWEAWQAALDVERGASGLTRAYALVRAGQPPEPAPGEQASSEWAAYQQAVATIEAAG